MNRRPEPRRVRPGSLPQQPNYARPSDEGKVQWLLGKVRSFGWWVVGIAVVAMVAQSLISCVVRNGEPDLDVPGATEFVDSPFAAMIPECGELWGGYQGFVDNGSRYIIVGPESGKFYVEEEAVAVTRRECRSPWWEYPAGIHISEFETPAKAVAHVQNIGRAAGKASNYDFDFGSVFGPWQRENATYVVVGFGPEFESDPDEIGLHISRQIGNLAIDHSGNMSLNEPPEEPFMEEPFSHWS